VDDAVPVGVFERSANLESERDRFGRWEAVILCIMEACFEIASAHELAHDEGLAVLITRVEDGHDAGMIAEASHGLGFAPHARAAGFVEPFDFDQCQGDVTIQPRVAGKEDPLLGAFAEWTQYAIAIGGECRWSFDARPGGDTRNGSRGCVECAAALAAEPELWGIGGITLRALLFESRAALATELHSRRVFETASRTRQEVESPLLSLGAPRHRRLDTGRGVDSIYSLL
jgi:hypothetical protein